MSKIISLLFLLILAGCFQSTPKTNNPVNSDNDTYQDTGSATYDLVYVDDEFDKLQFPEELTVESINKLYPGFLTLKKTTLRNMHDSLQIDTLYNFMNGTTEFCFYKTPDKEFFINAQITSDKINLARQVKIGISKQEFKLVFPGIKNLGDSIEVTGTEMYNSVMFYFANDRLSKIRIDNYID